MILNNKLKVVLLAIFVLLSTLLITVVYEFIAISNTKIIYAVKSLADKQYPYVDKSSGKIISLDEKNCGQDTSSRRQILKENEVKSFLTQLKYKKEYPNINESDLTTKCLFENTYKLYQYSIWEGQKETNLNELENIKFEFLNDSNFGINYNKLTTESNIYNFTTKGVDVKLDINPNKENLQNRYILTVGNIYRKSTISIDLPIQSEENKYKQEFIEVLGVYK